MTVQVSLRGYNAFQAGDIPALPGSLLLRKLRICEQMTASRTILF